MKKIFTTIIIGILCLSMFSVFAQKAKADPSLIITSVSPVTSDITQTIVIQGSGFGNTTPQTVPVGDGSVDTVLSTVTPSIAICDNVAEGGVGRESWAAGHETSSNFDAIGIFLVSWSDTQIIVGGFGSALGNATNPSTWNIAVGDPIEVHVFGPNNDGQATFNLTVTSPTARSSSSNLIFIFTPATNGLTAEVNGGVYRLGNMSANYVTWYWGDGTINNGSMYESHTYASSGTYEITVTAFYPNGSTASASANVTVAPGQLSNGYNFTINAGLGGSVSYSGFTSGTISPGNSVTLYVPYLGGAWLTALPSNGYVFSSWSVPSTGVSSYGGAVNTTAPSLPISITVDSSIQANFVPSNLNFTSPTITSVSFSGSAGSYTMTISGSGFGTLPISLPYFGDTSYFRIMDAAQLGHSEWGYTGDANQLNYESWTDTQIVMGSFGGSPGDAVAIALWNPSTGVGATWGGNVPPVSPGTPQITSVTFAGSGQNLGITIQGSGFGNSPVTMPFTGDLNYFFFNDFRQHTLPGSSLFGAGATHWGASGTSPDTVTMIFTSWSNNQIQTSGFAGTYGQNGATVQAGDPVTIIIWSTSDTQDTGPQTAWGGNVLSTSPLSLVIDQTPNVQLVTVPFPMTFTAIPSGGEGPYSVSWTITAESPEVGSSSVTGNPFPYTFSLAGDYLVSATVTDSRSNTASSSETIEAVGSGYQLGLGYVPGGSWDNGPECIFAGPYVNPCMETVTPGETFSWGGTIEFSTSTVSFNTNVLLNSGWVLLPQFINTFFGLSNPWYDISFTDPHGNTFDSNTMIQISEPDEGTSQNIIANFPLNGNTVNSYLTNAEYTLTACPSDSNALSMDFVSDAFAAAGFAIPATGLLNAFATNAALYLSGQYGSQLADFASNPSSANIAQIANDIWTGLYGYLEQAALSLSGSMLSAVLSLEHEVYGFLTGAIDVTYDTGAIIAALNQGDLYDTYTVNTCSLTASATANVASGSASADETSITGVDVVISGASVPDGTELIVTSTNYGTTPPPGTGTLQAADPNFYDVQISSSAPLGPDAMAVVNITNPDFTAQNSAMSYWDGNGWVPVPSRFISPDTVCGNFSVSDLTGTPIMVSSSSSCAITFDQLGVGSDYGGTVLIVDGASYNASVLPVTFIWSTGSTHTFAFQSPLTVTANAKQYVWTGTSGLSSMQSGSINVTTYGSIIGNYTTQYFLTVTATASPTTISSGETSTIKVTVTSAGTPVSGAAISLTSDKGGSFSSVIDYANGTYSATFTAPTVTTQTTITITANTTKTGYLSGQSQTQITAEITSTTVIPEFQPSMLLALFMVITLIGAIILKRKRKARN